MKKKISATVQDKKDWFDFTQKQGKVYNKESELTDRDINKSKITKLKTILWLPKILRTKILKRKF